jgi:hypothetical protein
VRQSRAQWLGKPGSVGAVREIRRDCVIVWCIYEVKGDEIAVVTLVGQRTDPQTARFIEWLQAQPPPR